jgi:putative flippase GtrA
MWTRTLNQYLRFGVSGILSVAISEILFYGFKGRLPDLIWTFWSHPLDLPEMSFYVVTSIIGGSIHFLLSKIWVFEAETGAY